MILVYKNFSEEQWYLEKDNPSARRIVENAVYDFSIPVDIPAVAAEATSFLLHAGKLLDPERLKDDVDAMFAVVEKRKGESDAIPRAAVPNKRKPYKRNPTRKQRPTIELLDEIGDEVKLTRNQKKKLTELAMTEVEDELQDGVTSNLYDHVETVASSYALKKADKKPTPKKSESEEFRILKEEMALFRTEITKTLLNFASMCQEKKENVP